jgi:hypothetical protein
MDYVDQLLKTLKISPPDVAQVKTQVEKILRGLQLL